MSRETTTRTLADGTVVKKVWRYEYRNGYSAWRGYVWRHHFEVTLPNGVWVRGSSGRGRPTTIKKLIQKAQTVAGVDVNPHA